MTSSTDTPARLPDSAAAESQSGLRARMRRRPSPPDLLLGAAVVALLVFLVLTAGFFTQTSLVALLSDSSITGIIALGMTVIALSGNVFSLSLGVTASVATLVCLATLQYGLAVSIIVTLLVGGVIFAVQGLIVGALGANPVIIAVASLAAISGTAIQVTGGSSIQPSGSVGAWLNGSVGVLPVVFVVFLALAIIGQVTQSGTTFGRRLLMTGSNREAAEVSGQPVVRAIVIGYGVAGACAAVVGIFLAERYGATGFSQSAGGGVQYDYDAIAAVLVGGTSLRGGQGAIWRTVVGVFFIEALSNALLLHGYSTEARQLATGVVVAVALIVSDLRSRGSLRQ